jgi:hypothetical protein
MCKVKVCSWQVKTIHVFVIFGEGADGLLPGLVKRRRVRKGFRAGYGAVKASLNGNYPAMFDFLGRWSGECGRDV